LVSSVPLLPVAPVMRIMRSTPQRRETTNLSDHSPGLEQ
jgi:hypothetical protein